VAKVLILLGGNQNNTIELFKQSISFILNDAGTIVNKSSIYKSAPWGFEAENDFLNQIIELDTQLPPLKLLLYLLDVESVLGRVRLENGCYSSRGIDIDILFYDDLVLETNELTIPHPRLHLRKFTLMPLVELWPNFVHPVLLNSMAQLLRLCNDKGDVCILD
jgi:2-amino-4-hydroxy-6-hydroxymethyldihydropteridine diphosphokinase